MGAQSYNSTGNADVLKIVETRIHPNYLAQDLTYDLAVLTLEKKNSFSPVKLPVTNDSSSIVKATDLTTALGWGGTKQTDYSGFANLHCRASSN